MMQIQSCYGICCRYSKEQFLKVLLMKLSLMPPSPTCSVLIPYRVGLCLEAPCTQSTRSLYPQGWILKPPPYWRHWRPWRWSWSLGRRWRSPKWLGEALMTHLCSDGVMGPKKKAAHLPQKWWHDGLGPLEASWCGWGGWRSPKEVLGPTLSGLITLQPLTGSRSSYMMMMTL